MSIGNSSADDRPSIGQALQQARIDAGLTVGNISSTTRVRSPIVHAIEQDDFSGCGGDVYARGHIRTLATAVGLDPAELIAQFDAEHGGRPEPSATAPLFEAERFGSQPRRPNWSAAMVAAIVAVVGFAGFTLFRGGDEPSTEAVGDAPSAEASSSPEADTTEPADPKPDPTESAIAAAPGDKVTIKLTAAKGRSWISAQDHNGRLLHEGVLEKGDSKTFTDDQRIQLVLGNAGAMELYVNGKQIKDHWKTGQIQHLTYTKGDPEAG
ncbi:helix-turn-helix domain-containing protein [Streptomyces sp. TP-A0874]|uniref:helix-turn-helix domain-containing protein n=1 Tax=Streptomyces sp. TP-A0874 TaxID=549819 RepID=UPI000853A6B5|nr:helix-turn-helix domain-containing protein [Streptomyces sp. TP-A0874]